MGVWTGARPEVWTNGLSVLGEADNELGIIVVVDLLKEPVSICSDPHVVADERMFEPDPEADSGNGLVNS